MDRNELERTLRDAGIPLEQWGAGKAKGLDDLLDEIEKGEAELEGEGESLLRIVKTAGVIVYAVVDGTMLALVEDRQEMKGGDVRRRELESSVSEKVYYGESAARAAWRAMCEELGIEERFELAHLFSYSKGPVDQGTYPGLKARYDIDMFAVLLPAEHFRPEGYVERGQKKTSYFIWRQAVLSGKPWIPKTA